MNLRSLELFYIIYIVDFVIFLIFLSLLDVLFFDINGLVSSLVRFSLNVILIVYLLLIFSLGYGIMAMIITYRSFSKDLLSNLNETLNRVAIGLFIFFNLFFIGLIFGLFDYSKLIFQRIEFYLPILYGISLSCLILILFLKSKTIIESFKLIRKGISTQKVSKRGCIVVGLIILSFLLPFLIVPSIVIDGPLPPKPKIIAHRGASYLAPENTLSAMRMAMEYNASGVEIDVRISQDGVPFLLHDATFFRTTNISEEIPDRVFELAENFTIDEIARLDAGSFFVDQDPYGTIRDQIITQKQANTYRGEKIPTYREVLDLLIEYNLELDLDLWIPPLNHPYYESFFEIVLNETIVSGYNLSNVILPTNKEGLISSEIEARWLKILSDRNIKQIQLGWEGTPSVDQMRKSIYTYINTGDGYSNAQYRELAKNNIQVMVWTIDAKERFSELWCLGVTWIKTNKPHEFNVNTPFWYISSQSYTITWALFSLMGLIPIVLAIRKTKY